MFRFLIEKLKITLKTTFQILSNTSMYHHCFQKYFCSCFKNKLHVLLFLRLAQNTFTASTLLREEIQKHINPLTTFIAF